MKQIDSLRYDRNRFEQVYEKLEKERVRLRQEIGKVIEESKQSNEQRWASVVFNSLSNTTRTRISFISKWCSRAH